MNLQPTFYLYIFIFLGTVFFVSLIKMIIAKKSQNKIREYQGEISKSHSKILKLEVNNEKLQKRISELENLLRTSQLHLPN